MQKDSEIALVVQFSVMTLTRPQVSRPPLVKYPPLRNSQESALHRTNVVFDVKQCSEIFTRKPKKKPNRDDDDNNNSAEPSNKNA